MNVFVTGASGFVGRRLVAALRDRGTAVRGLARSPAAEAAVAGAGAEPVAGELLDDAALRRGMAGCDTVFHVAAKTDDWGPEREFLRVNVEGTERVLAAARETGVRRMVHVSTEAVLGDHRPIVNRDETWPRAERPIGLYPRTKALAEARVIEAARAGLDAVVVRPRLVWGPGDTTILPRLVEAVRSGRFAWIEGGRYLTSTCHVANVCEGLMAAAQRGRRGEIYFVTDGPPIEFRAFVTALLASQGLSPGDRTVPRWAARALAASLEVSWRALRLSGTPPITRTAVRLGGEEVTVDDSKARTELGYLPVVAREVGLAGLRRIAPAA